MSAPGTNWQIMLADLAIVLFLTTFSALARDRQPSQAAHVRPTAQPRQTSPAVAEPVALWRAGEGAPPLAAWLKDQGFDRRMRVNVVGAYVAGDRDRVLAQADSLSADPALTGRPVRMILEPASTSSVIVTLSYDRG